MGVTWLQPPATTFPTRPLTRTEARPEQALARTPSGSSNSMLYRLWNPGFHQGPSFQTSLDSGCHTSCIVANYLTYTQNINSACRSSHFVTPICCDFLPHWPCPFASISVQAEIMGPKLLKMQRAEATSDLTVLRSSHRNPSSHTELKREL